uniref:tectonic-1 isoform X2 n=1 Tax=Myxine glutinosa TaxID=7769 RepID=UPI0035901347
MCTSRVRTEVIFLILVIEDIFVSSNSTSANVSEHGNMTNLMSSIKAGSGPCTCDLHTNLCDIHCCCDPDCSSRDILVFSSCSTNNTHVPKELCIDASVLFKHNSPYNVRVREGMPRLFCISLYDFYEKNFFVNPQEISDINQFDVVISQFAHSSFFTPLAASSSPTFYKFGDPVLILHQAEVLGYFALPVGFGSNSYCIDESPAAFLVNKETACERRLKNLEVECEITSALRFDIYTQVFRIVRSPEALRDEPMPDDYVTIEVSSSEASVPLVAPKLAGSDCMNVVTMVQYELFYNGTEGILSATAVVTLTTVPITMHSLAQSFTIRFRQVQVDQVFQRSGNPGYLVGKPLLAATRSSLSTGLVTDTMRWHLRLPSGLGGDTCARTSATFGEDLITGCTLSVHGKTCMEAQQVITSQLLGQEIPTLLGKFGNSHPKDPGQWLTILGADSLPNATGTCEEACSLVLGVQVHVFWAYTGTVYNPQAHLVAARYTFSPPVNVLCHPFLSLSAAISFTDASRPPLLARSVPAVEDKAPLDFFLPFSRILRIVI